MKRFCVSWSAKVEGLEMVYADDEETAKDNVADFVREKLNETGSKFDIEDIEVLDN